MRNLIKATVICALLAGPVSAGVMNYNNDFLGHNVKYYYHGHKYHAKAGRLTLTLEDGAPMFGYVADLSDEVDDSWVFTEQDILSLGQRGEYAAFLYETFGPEVDSSFEGAGLQIAIWEVLHDDNLSLYSGDFQMSKHNNPHVLKHAMTYLDALPISYTPAHATFLATSTNGSDSPKMVVPEPDKGMLCLIGFSLVFMFRWDRKRCVVSASHRMSPM